MPDPVVPAATPASETPAPTSDPVKQNLLSEILGLVKPEEKDVRPPERLPADPPKPEPVKSVAPVDDEDDFNPYKELLSKVEAKIKPAEPEKKEEPKPEPEKKEEPKPEPEKPKVKVGVKKPVTEQLAETLDKLVANKVKEVLPAPTPTPEPKKEEPVTPPIPDDLTEEEREELELAIYAEQKDPSKKGLADKFRAFYKANTEFLEKATAAAAKDGEEYDPSADAEYKKFLARNAPTLSASERKRLFAEKVKEEAVARAAREAEEKISPKLRELERKLHEQENKPKVAERVQKFATDVLGGMPEEPIKFFVENGRDYNKTVEQFPIEAPIIAESFQSAKAIAEEFLAVRHGLKNWEPAKNPQHEFLARFVEEQASAFEKHGGDLRVRDGKQFIAPGKWKPEMASTHWTFENEDILDSLRVQAARDAKMRIEAEYKRHELIAAARARKSSAPSGAVTPTVPKEEPTPSPRVNPGALPGVADAPKAAPSMLSSILGLPSSRT